MKLDRISERVYANTEGRTGGNVGIVVLDDRVLAVDAQYPVSGADFRSSIQTMTRRPITHLLLTHSHGDHVHGAQAFEDCDVVAHYRLREKMEEGLKTFWGYGTSERMIEEVKRMRPENAYLYEGIRIVPPKTTFKRSYAVGDIKMIHAGGHTDCSSMVYVSRDKTLFAGDLLFVGRFPWGGDGTADPDRWIAGLKKILKMDVKRIVPGHGPLCDKAEVEKQLRWFRAIRLAMKRQINSGVLIDEALKQDSYPYLYPADRSEWIENTFRHWYSYWSKKTAP